MRFFLVVIMTGVVFLGCKNYLITPEGGIRPRKPHYNLARHKLSAIDSLDTNAVYIAVIQDEFDSLKNDYVFLRFFSKGRVFSSFPISSLRDSSVFNNLNSGVVGYFAIQDSVINIELFGLFFSDYQYMTYSGKLTRDGILITRSRLSKLNSFEESIYYKKQSAKLIGTATW